MANIEDLQTVRSLNAYQLAHRAKCGDPENSNSAGAEFLLSVRNSFIDLAEYGKDEFETWAELFSAWESSGSIDEIADGAPNTYTHQRWLQFIDLLAYREEPEAGEWPKDLFDMAGAALYQIAERLVRYLVVEVTETCNDCEHLVRLCECKDVGNQELRVGDVLDSSEDYQRAPIGTVAVSLNTDVLDSVIKIDVGVWLRLYWQGSLSSGLTDYEVGSIQRTIAWLPRAVVREEMD